MVTRLYTAILRLYPRQFRREFGEEMQAVFDEAISQESNGSVAKLYIRELFDLPGVLFQQYYQQPVWVLSTAGAFHSEADQLEARLRREAYRRQLFSIFKAVLFIALFTITVYLHGYLYTIYTIHQSVQEFGTYFTLDEAIQSLDKQYERYYHNIKSISITSQDPIKAEYDFLWEVRINIYAETYADGSPINHPFAMGKIYYIHTRNGWVPYVKEIWIEVGFLPYWMKFYNLYGE